VTVPILYYHYIRVNPNARDQAGFKLSVTPGNFTQQMALLRDEGAHTITMDTLMAALQGGLPLPSRSVVLTFDDGHDDFATQAAAVLIADGLTATSFVVPGFLGRNSYMTTNQVQAVAAEGFTIGAHTMHHVDLVAQPASIANLEIMESRQVLRQLTGQPVLDFAYPYGALDGAVQSMVRCRRVPRRREYLLRLHPVPRPAVCPATGRGHRLRLAPGLRAQGDGALPRPSRGHRESPNLGPHRICRPLMSPRDTLVVLKEGPILVNAAPEIDADSDGRDRADKAPGGDAW